MAERTTARASYAVLDAAGAEWAPPVTVRRAMANWTFPRAAELMKDATAVLATRDELTAVVKPLGLSLPADLEGLYETSVVDMNKAQENVDDQLDAAKQIIAAGEAIDAEHGLFSRVGLAGTSLRADLNLATKSFELGENDQARSQVAAILATIDASDSKGKHRALLAGLALLGVLLVIVVLILVVRRRRWRSLP